MTAQALDIVTNELKFIPAQLDDVALLGLACLSTIGYLATMMELSGARYLIITGNSFSDYKIEFFNFNDKPLTHDARDFLTDQFSFTFASDSQNKARLMNENLLKPLVFGGVDMADFCHYYKNIIGTPTLALSQLIADISYIGIEQADRVMKVLGGEDKK
jgi:hypothetical protein